MIQIYNIYSIGTDYCHTSDLLKHYPKLISLVIHYPKHSKSIYTFPSHTIVCNNNKIHPSEFHSSSISSSPFSDALYYTLHKHIRQRIRPIVALQFNTTADTPRHKRLYIQNTLGIIKSYDNDVLGNIQQSSPSKRRGEGEPFVMILPVIPRSDPTGQVDPRGFGLAVFLCVFVLVIIPRSCDIPFLIRERS